MASRNTAQPNMHLLDVESDFINNEFWVRKVSISALFFGSFHELSWIFFETLTVTFPLVDYTLCMVLATVPLILDHGL